MLTDTNRHDTEMKNQVPEYAWFVGAASNDDNGIYTKDIRRNLKYM